MLEARTDTRGWAKERVLRVLLDPVFGVPGGRSVYQVAKSAEVSYSWVHDTWSDLVQAGAFEAPDEGQPRVADIGRAFEYWLGHRPRRKYADYHVLDGLGFLKSITQRSDMEYVATTYLAENLIQGHLFPRRFDLYIRQAQQRTWAKELQQRGFPVDSKAEGRGTIRLIIADPGVVDEVAPMQQAPFEHANPVRGIWIARLPLLIVDLLEEGGACAEAAAQLMETTYASTLQRS
jgi:hypothetical protein